MFDLGFTEVTVVCIVALIIVGPERLPKLAKTIGIFFGKAQRFITDIKHDIDEQVRSDEIEEIKKSVDDAAKQIDASLKDEVNFIEDEIKDEKVDSTIDEIVNAKKKLDKITPRCLLLCPQLLILARTLQKSKLSQKIYK